MPTEKEHEDMAAYIKSLKNLGGRKLFNKLFTDKKSRKSIVDEMKKEADIAGMEPDEWMHYELTRDFEQVNRPKNLHKNQEAMYDPLFKGNK